ncbi:sulfotransferase domain protein [Asticcacaulis biprosthecium C19]|uniref:Sulfotransferase domain protein n=1 Tax=Asticcacaulis biprosthecium C19 TaxID=715226 RepID=F4QL97_9CAUL|nr:tetratricopeptide repeat-containing sulfotransferase family protein [Asticcacaulis biprosthecium]EGF93472.1 sulfotransferase domain protein [Asticcacaulis biprosthecium C19]
MAASPHPLVLNGRQAFKAGDLPGAMSLCEMRLNDSPTDTQALELKAVILQGRGDMAGAEAAIRQAIAADPACDWALNDLTLLLRQQGRVAEAEMAAREAVAARPADAQAHLQLGVVLAEKDDLPAAEYHNRKVIELAGPHPQALLNLGLTLYNQGQIEEAEDLMVRVHRQSPDNPMIMAHISRLHEAKRDMPGAFAWLDRAEAAGRKTGEDFTVLRAVYLRNAGRAQEGLDLLDRCRNLEAPARLERAHLLDRLGRYDEAWQGFVEAKAGLALNHGFGYPADKVAERYAALTGFFTKETVRRLPKARVRSDIAQPIFILGFPRSGTTMLEQMLASHPQAGAGGELPFVTEWQALVRTLLPGDRNFPEKLAFLTAADYHHVPGTLRDYYLGRAETYGILPRGRSRFTDKMPLNDVYLPLLQMAFPSAPIIRLVRHPLDIAISVLSHNLTHGEQFGYAIETILSHMTATHALNQHYKTVLEQPVMELKYEDFVADQDGQTRRVLGHCGLAYDPACLRFHENPRHAPTPSYAQVSQPLNSRSVGRWQNYRRHFEPYFDKIQPMIEDLGYGVA